MKWLSINSIRKKITLIVGVILLLLLLPSPISRAYAKFWAVTSFHLSQSGVIDGCGFNCDGCGVKDIQKRWLGYSVTLEYACGLLPRDAPEFHQTQTVFVSFLGTVHQSLTDDK